MHHLLLASLSVRSPQVLRLRDATTGQQVSLVGTVHYNPASVARAKEEVALASKRDRSLGAVVVESCTSRWTTSLEKAPPGSLIANLVCSEMQGAAGVALQKGVPIMLGDADAGAFLPRVRQLAQQSVRDLVSPFAGGWAAIVEDFGRTLPGTLNPADVAGSELLLEGERPIGIQAWLGRSLPFDPIAPSRVQITLPSYLCMRTNASSPSGHSMAAMNIFDGGHNYTRWPP